MLGFVSEALITPESFAEVFCDDLDLPANSFVPAVASAIQQQIKQNSSESEMNLEDVRDQRVIVKVCLPFDLIPINKLCLIIDYRTNN